MSPAFFTPLSRATRTLLAPAVALAWALTASSGWAQWQWKDERGRPVFSDTAPPASVPDSAIVRRPGPALPPSAPTPPAPAAAVPASDAAAAPAPDAEAAKKAAALEAKKKQAEAAEKSKQQAQAAQMARARADNCQRAQRSLAALSTEGRLSTINAQGERVFMNEDMRNNEKARLRQIIQQDCGPRPKP